MEGEAKQKIDLITYKSYQMESIKDILIVGFSNPTTEGIVLHFNKPTTLKTGRMIAKEFFVSWDKIGKSLVDDYSESDDVAELNKQRVAQGFPVI